MSDADAEAYFNQWVAIDAKVLQHLSQTRVGKHLRRELWVPAVLTVVGFAPSQQNAPQDGRGRDCAAESASA